MRGGREKDGAIADSKETFTFFFGSESPFSQWHPAEFEVEGVVYNCAEQYMMHRKAGRQTCSETSREGVHEWKHYTATMFPLNVHAPSAI